MWQITVPDTGHITFGTYCMIIDERHKPFVSMCLSKEDLVIFLSTTTWEWLLFAHHGLGEIQTLVVLVLCWKYSTESDWCSVKSSHGGTDQGSHCRQQYWSFCNKELKYQVLHKSQALKLSGVLTIWDLQLSLLFWGEFLREYINPHKNYYIHMWCFPLFPHYCWVYFRSICV